MISDDLDSWVRAQLVGVPEDLRKPTVTRAAMAAGIDPFAALEAVNRFDTARLAARAPAKPRLPSVIRTRRAEEREPLPPSQYVPATALEPFADPLVSSGAKVLLAIIRSLAGTSRVLETLTVSLAALAGCSRRSIQYWYRELVAAELLTHEYDRQRGIVRLTLSDLVLPSVPPGPPKRVRAPTPDLRFRERWARRLAALRELGRQALKGGAQNGALIKQVKESRGYGQAALALT